MNKTPTSKSAQATDIIKSALAKGTWHKFLPSERSLASELMISRACLRQALHVLTLEGYISKAEQSKRRKILKTPKVQSPRHQVVFLTSCKETEATIPTLIQIAELRSLLAKNKQQLTVVAPPFFQHENVTDRTLQSFIELYPDAHWILHQSPNHIQQWFSKQSLNAVVLGSRFPGITLPSIDTDLKSASRHAAGLLLAKGHTRIGLIRFRTKLAGDDFALEGINEAIQAYEHTHSTNVPYPIVIGHNFHSENLTTTLDRAYSSSTPPTALISVNDHHMVTAYTHLMNRGLSIPDDVSLISLTPNPQFKNFQPMPTHYSCGSQHVQAIVKHLAHPIPNFTKLILPEIIHGKTVSSL